MTDVPEHLLRRSRERREALGLGGDVPPPAEGGDAPAPGGGGDAPAVAAPVPAAAPAAPVIPDIPPPPPPPPYVAEVERQRVPMWVMPVLVGLPFWGILYFGAFGSHKVAEATAPDGAAIYSTSCASCHGATGEGGAGPALEEGVAAITFPDEADHITWLNEGSQSKARGTPYGDPARPGGQRLVATQGMPAFAGQLSPAEIQAVVTYEREEL